MAHRELLTGSQRVSLHAPASDERGMVRHYTLSPDDLRLINRRRNDSNRPIMLCYLRFPGRILYQGEQPPSALCAFIAEQLGLSVVNLGDYAPYGMAGVWRVAGLVAERAIAVLNGIGTESDVHSMIRSMAFF